MDTNFTVTTIYFDGQFWCALILRHLQNQCFVGRYVFGAEPSNPRLIEWMLNEFSGIKLFPVNQNELPKIRLKKIADKKRTDSNTKNQIPKSLKAFSAAQKEFLAHKKSVRRKQKRKQKEELWKKKHAAKNLRK